MPAANLPTMMHFQGTDAVIYGRIYNIGATLITQATIASIAYKVVDLDDAARTPTVDDGTLVVATVVFDTAQYDEFWKYAEGYNVRAVIPGAAAFPVAQKNYEIQVTLTTTGDGSLIVLAGQTLTRTRD